MSSESVPSELAPWLLAYVAEQAQPDRVDAWVDRVASAIVREMPEVAAVEGLPELLRVTVRDEGSGVSDDLVPKIFRRGWSGGGSSGVGLSLARALIEADGGRLELTSRVPAAFTIVVPTTAGGPITGTPGSLRADGEPVLARAAREPR